MADAPTVDSKENLTKCRFMHKLNISFCIPYIEQKLRTERVENKKDVREKLSPAESSFGLWFSKVPPGADSVNPFYWKRPSRVRFAHVTCIKRTLVLCPELEWNHGLLRLLVRSNPFLILYAKFRQIFC